MEEWVLEVKDLIIEYDGVRAVDGVSFCVGKAEQLTLLGPSGSGKTSILRGVAGLEPPQGGEIRLFGSTIFNKERKINVPPDKRGMAMVFQSYAIWPHMTVFENVAYPLRVQKRSKPEVAEKVKGALELTGMSGFEERPANNLSGGQQQRVALARAIVADPKIILLDEPLSNLDAKLRAKMRFELKQLQKSINVTSMYVTHDQEEAFVLSDRIILLRDGRVEQVGSPEDIYRTPQTKFVAEFIPSANLFTGRIAETQSDDRYVFHTKKNQPIICCSQKTMIDSPENYVVYANACFFNIQDHCGQGQPNCWSGTVKKSFFVGDFIEYSVETNIGDLIVRNLPTRFYHEGDNVYVQVDPEYCRLIPAD
ncbi:MAG: ABC transporter ATP-binding protein [Deltaproteobacteria bacterium]|nr:ABC transporter ATP-binding protein [Deltaproteobacteria bacterium]